MRKFSALSAIVFLALLLCQSCSQSSNVASGGAHLFLTANPPQVSVNGTSELTVSGTDENGVPLEDGTVVSFSVDQAGRVSPNSVHLLGGTGTTTYFSTNFTGDITVTATSGSVAANTIVTVSSDLIENVFVSAKPSTFPTGGGTSLTSAVVTDGSGRVMADTGVQFSTTEGTLQSGGGVIETNSNGVAVDTLNTTANATVTATTLDGFSGQATILVGVGRIVCHMTVSTTTPKLNQVVLFYDTSDNPGNQIARYHWDFGDGFSADGQNVQHAYSTAGEFDVVHSVTDAQGDTIFCETFPLQVSP